MNVTYKHVDPDGRLSFSDVDGSDVTVGGDQPFETDDPRLIAYLDGSPFVECVSRTEDAPPAPEATDPSDEDEDEDEAA